MFKRFAKAVRDNPQPKVAPGFLRPIDTDRLATELRLDVKAAERGRRNLPETSEDVFDSVEQEIIQRIESEWTWQGDELINNLRGYASRLIGYSILAEFEKLRLAASDALATLRTASLRARAELGPLQNSYIAHRNELENFRKLHQLIRLARNPPHKWTTFGLMSVLIIVESGLNGAFFAKGNEFGLLGGVITAIAISFLNVVLAFGVGFGPARLVNRRNFLYRSLGFVSTIIGIAILVGLHVFAVHFRDANAVVIGEDQAFVLAVQSLLNDPWKVSSLSSLYLFGLGLVFAVFAFRKGYTFDDPYPGYGPVERRSSAAEKAYSDEHALLFDDLQVIKEDTVRLLQDGIQRIPLFPQQATNIRNERAAMVQQFRAYEAAVETAANQLLKSYRDANRNWRTSAPPPHFNSNWRLTRSFLESPDTKVLLTTDPTSEPVNVEKCLSELRRLSDQVLAEYEKMVISYPHATQMNQ